MSGLRERKKRQTRENIETRALTLFSERGYDRTTLAEIAAAADVAPRTIFAYFESKEDILFCDEPSFYARLEHALVQRPGATTIDGLRSFLSSPDAADARARLRRRIIAASATLRASERARSSPLERLITESMAKDLGTSSDDVRPRLAAASATFAFSAVRNRLLDGSDRPLSHAETLEVLELALTFLRGGLDALGRVDPVTAGRMPESERAASG